MRVFSEILLQRTKAETVSRELPAILAQLPSWKSIFEKSEFEITSIVNQLGLAKQRSKRLKIIAEAYFNLGQRFPDNYSELTEIKGMGQYLANSILLFYHRRAVPLFDVNMAKVIGRYQGIQIPKDLRYAPVLKRESEKMLYTNRARALNWAIMDLSSSTCSKEPKCKKCPLQENCVHTFTLVSKNLQT